MRAISSAPPKRKRAPLVAPLPAPLLGPLAALILCVAAPLYSADWFVADASGIALGATVRARALRQAYALSIETFPYAEAPSDFREALPPGAVIELKTFFKAGSPADLRLTVLDEDGNEIAVESRQAGGEITRQRYDALRRLTEDASLSSDGSGTVVKYSYAGDRLVKAEAYEKADAPEPVATAAAAAPAVAAVPTETLVWTESYLYARSGALRAVTREYPSAAGTARTTQTTRMETASGVPRRVETAQADGTVLRSIYDGSGRLLERASVDSTGKTVGEVEKTEYAEAEGKGGSATTRRIEADTQVVVETVSDGSGRVVLERRTSKEGVVLDETSTEWSKDRVAVLQRRVGKDTRRTEYEYDSDGDRTAERNYRNGALERTVLKDGENEIELLYADGTPILRAVWSGGRKISEERLRKVNGSAR